MAAMNGRETRPTNGQDPEQRSPSVCRSCVYGESAVTQLGHSPEDTRIQNKEPGRKPAPLQGFLIALWIAYADPTCCLNAP